MRQFLNCFNMGVHHKSVIEMLSVISLFLGEKLWWTNSYKLSAEPNYFRTDQITSNWQ